MLDFAPSFSSLVGEQPQQGTGFVENVEAWSLARVPYRE
jgi:hypothetical protein